MFTQVGRYDGSKITVTVVGDDVVKMDFDVSEIWGQS
jgi:hypothetical protein